MTDTNDDQPTTDKQPRTDCVMCGSTEFTWRKLSGERRIVIADEEAWFPRWSGLYVRARHCNHCGHVALFARPDLQC